MQISRVNERTISLKGKRTEVLIDSDIKIDNLLVHSPGEYDIAGVSIQGLRGDAQTIYLLQIEDMRICVIPDHPQKLSSELTELIGNVDMVFVPVKKGINPADIISMVNTLDPSAVIPFGDGDITEFAKLTTQPEFVGNSLKITKSLLPTEGRLTYCLLSN